MEHLAGRKPGPAAYNHGCRCKECTRLNTERHARLMAVLRARGEKDPDLIPHGTFGGYSNWGCRGPRCTKANSDASADRRARARQAA